MMPYMDVMSVYDPVSVPITPFFFNSAVAVITKIFMQFQFSATLTYK